MIAKIIFVRIVAPSAFQRNIKWNHLFGLSLIFYHEVLLLGTWAGWGECFYAKCMLSFANLLIAHCLLSPVVCPPLLFPLTPDSLTPDF